MVIVDFLQNTDVNKEYRTLTTVWLIENTGVG